VIGALVDMNNQEFMRHAAAEMVTLQSGEILTIIEAAQAGVVVLEVLIDASGTPRMKSLGESWRKLRNVEGELSEGGLLEFSLPRNQSRLVLACSAQGRDPVAAFRLLRRMYPLAPACWFREGELVIDAIEDAMARVPLRQRYDLVVLRRTEVDNIEQDLELLFAAGAMRGGHPRRIRIRIEPGGEYGTTFAVLASDEDDDEPQYRLVSVGSAVVPPGAYMLSAALVRPGEVRFDLDGDQLRLLPDDRSWPEILAAAPERLDRLGPAHLILAIEACGPDHEYLRRVGVASDLVAAVEKETAEPVAYSLITYVGHVHNQYDPERDRDPELLAWGKGGTVALGVLRGLTAVGAPPGSPSAAQLECALALAAEQLATAGPEGMLGRPVLITIGSREPYPSQRDPRSRVRLPCPYQNDWRRIFDRLRKRYPGIAFGAIHDSDSSLEVWRHLGGHAQASLAGDVDIRGFAAELGLVSSGLQSVPFPLLDAGGR
jgi:hypothetical protein